MLGGVGLNQQPLCIIAKTNHKGGGVSFLQRQGRLARQTLRCGRKPPKAVAELQPSSQSATGVTIPQPAPACAKQRRACELSGHQLQTW